MSEYKDYIVRATAADHQLRAFAVTSRDIVEKAREILVSGKAKKQLKEFIEENNK